MKKYLPFAIGLIITLGSVAFGQDATHPAASPSPSPRPAMSKAQIQKHLIATEKKLWDAWKNKDIKPFKATLSADAVMVGENGIANKDTTLKMMGEGGCDIKSYELSEFKLTMINSSTALLTYKGTTEGTCGGTAIPAGWCSSIYVNRGGKWYAFSHQETQVR